MVFQMAEVPQCWILGERAYCWAFLTGMLAELTVSGVEIEPHIVLLYKSVLLYES